MQKFALHPGNTHQFAFTKDCWYTINTAVIKEKEHREDWSVCDVLACPEKLQDKDISNLIIPVLFFVYEA